MKKIFLIMLPLIFSGCASTVPEPKIITQTVEVPVLKTCYGDSKIPDEPKLLTDGYDKTTQKDVWLNGAFVDIDNLKTYSNTLKTFICNKN